MDKSKKISVQIVRERKSNQQLNITSVICGQFPWLKVTFLCNTLGFPFITILCNRRPILCIKYIFLVSKNAREHEALAEPRDVW